MPIHKTEAIVLNRYDFRETSLIANFYTKDFGRLSGILKGLRQTPPKFASTVEVFSHNDIVFYRKINSSLHLVSQAYSRDNFSPLRQDILKAGFACGMMELLNAIMPQEDKNEEVFALALSCLQELKSTSNPYKISTIFKIKMLSLSGFKPHFDSCVSCQERSITQLKFSLSLGGLLCPRCQHKDLSSRSIFRGTAASILHIERNDLKNNLNLG